MKLYSSDNHYITTPLSIKNTITFVASDVRKLLHMSTKLKLDWNTTDRQTKRNKDHQRVWLQERSYLHRTKITILI